MEKISYRQATDLLSKRTVCIDPRKLVLEHNVVVAEKWLESTNETVERHKKMYKPDHKKSIEGVEMQLLASNALSESQKALAEYEADGVVLVELGFVTEEQLVEYDVGKHRIVMDRPTVDQDIVSRQLDRSLVLAALRGHTGIEIETGEGVVCEVEYSPDCIDLYYRFGWLPSLAWKVRAINNLSGEKKSKS